MSEPSFDERELILELFPGTDPDLLPPGEVLYYRDEEGKVHIAEEPLEMVLEPLEATPSTAPVLCEACLRQMSRASVQFFRFSVGPSGRRWRYLTLCRDTNQCNGLAEPRRLRELLRRSIISDS